LDSDLGVAIWETPGKVSNEETPIQRHEEEGPSWWHGDEEASQIFLGAMGVRLE
jgi:hypothetical protein